MAVALYFYRGLIFRDRSRTPGGKAPREATARSNTISRRPKINPSSQGSAQPKQEREGMDELKNYDPKKTLSRREYGKDNPFAPLAQARPRRTPKIPPDLRDEVAKTMSPLIELTGVLGDTAFLKVDGEEESVSANDTVAGMKVLEVGDNSVRLSKGDNEYTITLGKSFRVPTGEAK